MGPGAMSMRPGLPVIPKYNRGNATRNYFLFMKRRKSGLLSQSGSLNGNI